MAFDATSSGTDYSCALSEFPSWPSTLCAWAKPTAASSGVILGLGDKDASGSAGVISLWDASDTCAGQPVETAIGGGDNNTAYASTTYTADTWNHFCATHDSNGGVNAYLNGGNKGTDTTNTLVPFQVDKAIIGGRKTGIGADQHVEAEIAWVAVWDVQLTDAEVAMLGVAGVHPMLVRPQNLQLCCDLLNDPGNPNITDRIQSNTWTESGVALLTESPPIVMPSAQILQFPTAGAAPAGSYTIYENYYRQLMAGS